MKGKIVKDLSFNLNAQGRRWLLVLNNPMQTDDQMIEYLQNLEHFKYSIFQRERGHEKEIEHLHLFIVFAKKQSFFTIKKYFPTAFIVQAIGSNVQCRNYCSKNDLRVSGTFELGQFVEDYALTDK